MPRVSFSTLFLGILIEMIETNFSVSVWHILMIIHLSAIESGGYSPHSLAAISITIHLLLGEYLLILYMYFVFRPQFFTVLFFLSHDSYPLVGIFFCNGFPPKGKLNSLARTANCGNKVDIIAFHYYPPDPISTTSLNLRGSQ